MHKLAKEIMDRVKSKINSSGIDAITEQELIEMKYWTAVADNMTSFDYHFKIIEEMEKPENQYGVNYDENGKLYYSRRRDSRGRYMYSEPEYHMSLEQYKEHTPEEMRDMDRKQGRMYYTEPNANMNKHLKRYYEHKGMADEHKKLESLEQDLKEISEEITQLIGGMENAERTMLRTKLQNISNMI